MEPVEIRKFGFIWWENALNLMTQFRTTWVLALLRVGMAVLLCTPFCQSALSDDDLPSGFQQLHGKYITVITDLPLDDHVRELPLLFDKAVPQWCNLFGVPLKDVADWHVEAYVMKFRERFRSAGFIPVNLPDFPFGFQFGNKVWVMEQPSEYYRRHLLLHEGTHWFMNRKYGSHGPPWLMEGMAEWLGTHRWDGTNLTLGIIPATRDEVPYWGRALLIQQQLAEGVAPSLESILRYSNTAHQEVDAYAWSWAAVLFLRHHPTTQKAFEQLLKQPMKPDSTGTRWLFGRLKAEWAQMRCEWNAMVSELEYGYDPTRGFLELRKDAKPLDGQSVTFDLYSNRTWQSSGVTLAAGDKIVIDAAGEYVIGEQPKPWRCTPDGVTLEYYRGQPLGKLMLTVVQPVLNEPQNTDPLDVVPVGSHLEYTAKMGGELQFRINESNAGLGDNSGATSVTIRKR
jgi:hypothetical protein